MNKIILYQIFTRLFGNDNTQCVANGSIEQNGCGKFANTKFSAVFKHQHQPVGRGAGAKLTEYHR